MVHDNLRFVATYQDTADRVLDALGDGTRRELVDRLRSGSLAVGELADGVGVSRPAVSQHLRVLLEAGLLEVEQVGTRRYYRVRPEGLSGLRDWLASFWEEPVDEFRRAAEARARKAGR
jgi:DNA-binding transcriptional ArsR family regulator